jgi:hypothetical protein
MASLTETRKKTMKKLVSIALLGVVILSGCASTAPGSATPSASPTTAAAPATPVQQPVTIPAAAAKKVVLVMTGSKTVVEAKDWAAFKDEWRHTFSDYAKESGIAFSMLDRSPPSANEAGTLLSVYVNDYRMVGIGARIFLGVMTGNAYIDAKVDYRDLKTGQSFGAQDYNTSSSAWQGIFGKMTPQQVDSIGKQVFGGFKPQP